MRRLLIVLAVLLVVAVVAMVLLRRTLLQGELRERVEARLSATLGQPVSIGRLGVSLVPRLAVSGSDVRIGDAPSEAPGVAIAHVRMLPRLGALLSGDVVIEQVQLDGFVVSVLSDEDGWQVPAAVPSPTSGDEGGIVIERVRLADARIRLFDRTAGGEIQERASIDELHADVTVEGGGLRLSSISGRVGEAAISGDARIDPTEARLDLEADRITDADLPAFLELLGSERPEALRLAEAASMSASVRVDRMSARLSGTGTLRAPEVVLDPLRLQRFEAPFVIDGPRLSFEPATFALYDGAHEGRVDVDLSTKPPSWTIDSRVTSLDAGAFLTALNGSDQRLDGTASVESVLRGRVGEPLARTVRGRARVEVTEGVVREFPLLAAINRALRLAEQEGSDTRFSRLSATLAVASGGATTEDLVLESTHVRVAAAGRIGADRSLDLRGVAAISPERSRAAIASIRELTGLRNARGEVEVPLTISGTVDAPSFAIDLEAVIRKGIADELRRRLLRIIRD